MTYRRPLAVAVVLAATGLLLSGCFTVPEEFRTFSFAAPEEKQPPPLPQRKPAPPVDFAAWTSGSSRVAATPGPSAVEVAPLGPQGARPSAPPPPAARPAAAPLRADGRYVVAKGDSLYGISRRFGLPIQAVIDANELQRPYALTIGQRLKIPRARVHEVARGDTIFKIAARYRVDRRELVRLNDIQAPYTIAVGQRLILPPPGAAGAAPAPTAVAYAPPQTPPRTAPPAPKPAQAAPARGEPRPPVRRPRTSAETRAALANLPPRAGDAFFWPVKGPVLSSYGAKKGGEHNDGINIAAPRGTPVRAAENGVVAYAGEELKGFGKLLLIKHDGGWVTAYAHNQELLVQAGDRVKRGQAIARVGSSGSVIRPQLHFEVRRGTRAVNPEPHLAPRGAKIASN